MRRVLITSFVLGAALLAAASVVAQPYQAKLDAKKAEIQAWGKDPALVAAVKEYNAKKPDAAAAMTQAEWDGLSEVDPKVRGFLSSAAGKFLKSKKADWMSEAFVCGSDGTKAGFLQKTTSWSHLGKPKHDDPMKGQTWQGQLERDQSTGVEAVQVGVPVLDGTTVIGSLVVGVRIDKL